MRSLLFTWQMEDRIFQYARSVGRSVFAQTPTSGVGEHWYCGSRRESCRSRRRNEASAWYGLAAPKGTPPEIVDRLNKAVNEILADPKAKARFTEIGSILLPGSAADFGKLVADETDKWGKVVKFAGAKVD